MTADLDSKAQQISELESSTKNMKDSTAELTELKAELESYHEKLTAAEAEIKESKTAVTESNDAKSKLELELSALNDRVKSLTDEVIELRTYKESHPYTEDDFKAQVSKIESELENTKDVLKLVVKDFDLVWSKDEGKFVKEDK